MIFKYSRENRFGREFSSTATAIRTRSRKSARWKNNNVLRARKRVGGKKKHRRSCGLTKCQNREPRANETLTHILPCRRRRFTACSSRMYTRSTPVVTPLGVRRNKFRFSNLSITERRCRGGNHKSSGARNGNGAAAAACKHGYRYTLFYHYYRATRWRGRRRWREKWSTWENNKK